MQEISGSIVSRPGFVGKSSIFAFLPHRRHPGFKGTFWPVATSMWGPLSLTACEIRSFHPDRLPTGSWGASMGSATDPLPNEPPTHEVDGVAPPGENIVLPLAERFASLPSATLSDCLRGSHTLDPVIHCMTPGLELSGPAFTVLAEAGSIITAHKALLEAPEGTVLVVGGETSLDLNGALFGKLMGIQAKLRGIVGVIVDGPVRDVVGLREIGLPVFARCSTPRVGTNRTVGQTNVPAPCGGIIINPGDFVRADDDGVVVIPSEMLEQVVIDTELRVEKEAEYIRRMQAGEHITELIGLSKLIYKSQ